VVRDVAFWKRTALWTSVVARTQWTLWQA